MHWIAPAEKDTATDTLRSDFGRLRTSFAPTPA